MCAGQTTGMRVTCASPQGAAAEGPPSCPSKLSLVRCAGRTSEYVIMQVLEALQQGASHNALVCCAGYVLGEYGRLVPEVPTHVQFALLQERFLTVSNETKVGLSDTTVSTWMAETAQQ